MIADTIALLKHLREIEPHSQSIVDRCDAEIEWLQGKRIGEQILGALCRIDWTSINHPQANAEADVEIVRIK